MCSWLLKQHDVAALMGRLAGCLVLRLRWVPHWVNLVDSAQERPPALLHLFAYSITGKPVARNQTIAGRVGKVERKSEQWLENFSIPSAGLTAGSNTTVQEFEADGVIELRGIHEGEQLRADC